MSTLPKTSGIFYVRHYQDLPDNAPPTTGESKNSTKHALHTKAIFIVAMPVCQTKRPIYILSTQLFSLSFFLFALENYSSSNLCLLNCTIQVDPLICTKFGHQRERNLIVICLLDALNKVLLYKFYCCL